jgi:uncharacterized LabA/DUF88 family protein
VERKRTTPKDMDVKFMTSKEHLLNYIGKKYSSSEEVSIKNNQVTLLGHVQPEKHKIKSKFEKLEFWVQEQWQIDMKRYTDMMQTLNKNLTSCYAIFWGHQLKRESTYKQIDIDRDAPELFALITTVCNKTSNIDHYMMRSIDSLYSITELSGSKMSLGDFYKHFVAKRRTATLAGIEFNSIEQQTAARKTEQIKNGWTALTTEFIVWSKNVKLHAEEQAFAMIFLRQAGKKRTTMRKETITFL